MSDALVIAAHGSRDEAGVAEFRDLADLCRGLRPDRLQAEGFLEFARPTIGEAIDSLVARGARRVAVVPAMLMAAGHVKNDVPSEVHEARDRHPGVAFHMARALDIHPALLELGRLRYREALDGRVEVPASRTLLLVVGRGTSDPDANGDVAKVARLLWEGSGVGWGSVAYAGLTAPGVDEALTACRRLGFARIVVQPYLLFDGVLARRVREAAARHDTADPAVEVVAASHLGPHPLLASVFEDRAHEALHGRPAMNCDLCKYRVRLIGREVDLGAPQAGHHHHARAPLNDDDQDDDDHDHPPRRRPPRRSDPAEAEHPWDDRLLRRLQVLG